MAPSLPIRRLLPLALLSALPVGVLGGNILSTTGFSTCLSNGTVSVTKLDVSYDRTTRVLTYDVAGSSSEVQNVTASLVVSAYGTQVYSKTFSPCSEGMTEMCPVPAGTFASSGNQTIPEDYASQIPSIAFSIPDLDGTVKMEITNDSGDELGCIESTVGNGRSMTMPAIKYAAAGVAAGALALSAVSAVAAGGHPGASTSSPTFGEVIGWFQGIALNGMMSVSYPSVYRSFTTNFGFSTGLFGWDSMQTTIDNFRRSTGGNLTDDSYQYLSNATLMYSDGSNSTSSRLMKRALDTVSLLVRDTTVTVNGTSTSIGGGSSTTSASSSTTTSKTDHYVQGIEAYVEQLKIPQANTFMTILLIWAIVVGVIVILILLLKVILEAWSIFGNIPKSMESWRKRYWWRLAKALTNLILMLYGVWTMYCIYQWTDGDSWAAKLLAAVTWSCFTAVLACFTWRIFSKVRQARKFGGDAGSGLYQDKDTWVKYNLFYENFKHGYWWLFVPVIIYAFARGTVIAAANGHGLIQTGGQLIVEGIYLVLLLWWRPFQRKSGMWINCVIQVVRVLSVICVLVFVEELSISQTTKTIAGIALIIVQCVLTAVLAILIAVNALVTCIRENPHRKQRKAAAAKAREGDFDALTPLDARNSLLLEPMAQRGGYMTDYKSPAGPGGVSVVSTAVPLGDRKGRYDPVPARSESPYATTRPTRFEREYSDRQNLVGGAADMGHRSERSVSRSPSPDREPTLPNMGYGRAY